MDEEPKTELRVVINDVEFIIPVPKEGVVIDVRLLRRDESGITRVKPYYLYAHQKGVHL